MKTIKITTDEMELMVMVIELLQEKKDKRKLWIIYDFIKNLK